MSGGSGSDELTSLDPVYFADRTWTDRLGMWQSRAGVSGFSIGNERVVENALSESDAGLRAVVNIGAAALLELLSDEPYRNAYNLPLIGGAAKTPSAERLKVDDMLGIDAQNTYFAAVALGGPGVRYYGEYCMVLSVDVVPMDSQVFDRDSYDLLLPPLSDFASDQARSDLVVRRLRGQWSDDLRSMVLLRVLPEMINQPRLVTSGTISAAVLRDQEFIEVHLHLVHSFGLEDVEEIRESPDEVAVEMRLRSRLQLGRALSQVERSWLKRRELVAAGLDRIDMRSRVVTSHGQGYQWR